MPKLLNGAVRDQIERKVRVADREAVLPGSAGDLRAIPVVSRGVPGAVPGSDPERALLAKERRRLGR